MVTLAEIDRLIAEYLMPKTCAIDRKGNARRGRCMCGHVDLVHDGRDHRGRCRSSGRCGCARFKPYDYARETQSKLNKYRAFALALLDAEHAEGKGSHEAEAEADHVDPVDAV